MPRHTLLCGCVSDGSQVCEDHRERYDHIISERRLPSRVVLSCSCGWQQQFVRRVDASARAIRHAIALHGSE